MDDGIGLAEVLLELPGFEVLDAVESNAELVVSVQSRRPGRRAGVRD